MRPAVEVEATLGAARATTITTARGTIRTPCFMPVGTRGAVRAVTTDDLERLDAQVVLANAYHLMLRPGAERVAAQGGLHRFTGWRGHLLTDSGGYQVFSLAPTVDDDGVTFRSTYDGTIHRLRPEDAVEVQHLLGADIQMILDVCPALPADQATLRSAVDRTAAWAARGRIAFMALDAPRQSQFGIVQGGTDAELRRDSAERTVALDFDGYAIGGLSVGEERAALLDTVAATIAHLPADQPRYLMGVGDPIGLVEAIALGIDLFDCVLPTRLARHGTALSWEGKLHLKNARFADDDGPIDPTFSHPAAGSWSRAYLRHLLNVGESGVARMLTLHNLAWTFDLVDRARRAVCDGTLDTLRRQVADAWAASSSGPTGH